MKTKNMQQKSAGYFSATALAVLLLAGVPAAFAEDKDDLDLQECSAQIDAAVKTQNEAEITAKIAEKFTTLAGSENNATALVAGLHAGTNVTLNTTVNGEIVTTTFMPSTGQQGFGNVYISLSLAQAEFAKLSITNPTPTQLEAVLNGGAITTTSGTVTVAGILALRESGQGWGQIAKTLDLKLGPVVREAHAARENFERHARNDVSKHDLHGKSERTVDKLERTPSRIDRVDRVDRVDRAPAGERPARVEKPTLPDRPKH